MTQEQTDEPTEQGLKLGEFNRHCQCPAMSLWHSPFQGTPNLLILIACPCESACLAYAQGTPEMPGSKCPHWEQPPIDDPRELVAKYLNSEFYVGSQSSPDILTPVTNSDNPLDNIPLIGFLLFYFSGLLLVLLGSSPPNLLMSTSISQGLFLGDPNLRQKFRYTQT